MKHVKAFILVLLITLITSCNTSNTDKIHIATAANMQYVIKVLTETFTSQSGIKCELIIGSSGKLTSQIKEGAPYDVFVSANMKYPNEIYKNGLAKIPPRVYAYGKLVLWTLVSDVKLSVENLTQESIKNIAIANPKTAPYGEAAVSVLEYYNLLDTLNDKLVYGESISQTNQFITSKAAEVGFTAKAVVLSEGLNTVGKWIDINESLYQPISQGIVLIKNEKERNTGAQEFYEFLFSTEAKQILKNFGYSVDE